MSNIMSVPEKGYGVVAGSCGYYYYFTDNGTAVWVISSDTGGLTKVENTNAQRGQYGWCALADGRLFVAGAGHFRLGGSSYPGEGRTSAEIYEVDDNAPGPVSVDPRGTSEQSRPCRLTAVRWPARARSTASWWTCSPGPVPAFPTVEPRPRLRSSALRTRASP